MQRSLKPLKISHLSLGVSDVDVSERFYRDGLGLLTARSGDEVYVRWPDGFLLVLTPNPPAGRSKAHFGFNVEAREEVDAWAARIKQHGGEVITGPADRDDGRVLFFLDPDNYVIEIYSGD
ncbi:MAG: VOC family protein [Vulcanimicrobiaceae bacterium]